jgi:hypothetical protein
MQRNDGDNEEASVADKENTSGEGKENPYLGVPPVEPKPATPKRSAASKAESAPASTPIPPMVDLTGNGGSARPDPYASASAMPPMPPNPYVQASQQYASASQPYGAGYTPRPSSGLSITSMVLGIVGIVLCCFGGVFFSIAAIITGHIAQKSQHWARGFWLTGLITGYSGIALGVLAIIYYVGSFMTSYSNYNY